MESPASQSPSKPISAGDRALRSKTVFQIALPPASKKSITRLRRPRILLQLQQLSEHRRPLPVLDVLPSSYFAPRLAQRFPKIFNGKSSLGPNDIIVTNSNSSEGSCWTGQDTGLSSDDVSYDSREVVGTICREVRRPREDVGSASAEICLGHDLVWRATPLASGGYEFNATGADGSPLQARWVRRDRPSRRVTSLPPVAKRFTFSIINPSARRHPVIATMTNESIEVHDQYPAAVAQTVPQREPNSPISILSKGTSYFDIQDLTSQPKEPLVSTDHHLRSLIVITGIYVSLEEGWVNDTRGKQRVRDQEMDSKSAVDSKAGTAKVSRASTQIFHQRPSVLPDETYVETTSRTCNRAHSTQTANTDDSDRKRLSARLWRGRDDNVAILNEDGVANCSDGSSQPNSQGLVPYSKFRTSSELFRAGAKLPCEKSQFADVKCGVEEACVVRSPSTNSGRICEPKARPGGIRPGFRRFFSLPCIVLALASKVK